MWGRTPKNAEAKPPKLRLLSSTNRIINRGKLKTAEIKTVKIEECLYKCDITL